MRLWTLLLMPVLVLALAAGAEAKKNKQNAGLKGKIVSVSGKGTLMISTKGGKGAAAKQLTIHTDATTTIEVDGVSGKSVTDLHAGEKVVITGDPTGIVSDIQATSHKGKRHKKAA